MRKFIYLLICVLFISTQAFASWDVENEFQLQKRANQVGFHILNSNRIEHRMIFQVINRVYTRDIWADASSVNRIIWIKPVILPYLDSDEELAAVLSHEISHGVDTYEGALRGYLSILSYWVAPNKYDLKADKRAVDYMVNAGYNPLAIIVVMNKIGKQYRYDILSNHTLISRRMMMIYEYIYTKYPSFLLNNSYKDNIYYQNFLLTSRQNRLMLQEKIQNNSKKKLHYKY